MSLNRGFRYIDRIDRRSAGTTVLEYYASRYRHSSREQWRSRIERGAVRLGDREVAADTVLQPGQVLSYDRAPWVEPQPSSTFGLLYEDEHVVAVDKPSALPVLPGGHHLEHTLLALVRARFGGAVQPSPLHRLGRATSGIVLFARTRHALSRLSADFRERRVRKLYRALLSGIGVGDERVVQAPIGRVAYAPTGTLYAAVETGMHATSVFRTLHEDAEGSCSLVEARIVTGRPHQIRIHAAAMGHPLIGDPLYVAGGVPAPIVAGTRAPLPGDCGYHLHATRLEFRHPATNEWVSIFSPPPASFPDLPRPWRSDTTRS
jgi:23S rRNA pseudouridine1911/1915/1917 synthase